MEGSWGEERSPALSQHYHGRIAGEKRKEENEKPQSPWPAELSIGPCAEIEPSVEHVRIPTRAQLVCTAPTGRTGLANAVVSTAYACLYALQT